MEKSYYEYLKVIDLLGQVHIRSKKKSKEDDSKSTFYSVKGLLIIRLSLKLLDHDDCLGA